MNNNTDFQDYLELFEFALEHPDFPLYLYHYYHTDGAKRNPDVYDETNEHRIFRSREINSFWASPKLSAMKPQGVMLGITQFDQKTPDMLPLSDHLRLIPWRSIFEIQADGSLDNSKSLFIVEEIFHKRDKPSRIIHITLLWGNKETIQGLYPQQGLREIDLGNNSYLSLPLKADGVRIMKCPRNDTPMSGKYLKVWIHICYLGDILIPKHKSDVLVHREIIEMSLVKDLATHDFSNQNMSAFNPRAGVDEESDDQSSNPDDALEDDENAPAERNAAGDNMNIEEDEDDNLFAEDRQVAAEVNLNVEEESKDSQNDRAFLESSNSNPLVQSNPKASLSKDLKDSQASLFGSTQASTQANTQASTQAFPQANTQLDSSQFEEEKE